MTPVCLCTDDKNCEKYRNFTWFPGVEICEKARFPHSFGRIARNYAHAVPFCKISIPGNQVKLRYFLQWKYLIPLLCSVHFVLMQILIKQVMSQVGLKLFLKNGKTISKAPVMELSALFYRKSSVDRCWLFHKWEWNILGASVTMITNFENEEHELIPVIHMIWRSVTLIKNINIIDII